MSVETDTHGPVNHVDPDFRVRVKRSNAYKKMLRRAASAQAKIDLLDDYRFLNSSGFAARSFAFFAREYGLTHAQVTYLADCLGIRRI